MYTKYFWEKDKENMFNKEKKKYHVYQVLAYYGELKQFMVGKQNRS